MAIVTLSLNGNDFNLNPADLKDLRKATQDLRLVSRDVLNFIHDGALLSGLADGQLVSLALDAGNPSWTLDGSPATFSLNANMTASISVQSKGNLLTYYTDFANKNSVAVPAKSGQVYLVTEIKFLLSGDLSANPQIGAVGLKTDLNGSTTYTVQNFKAFSPDTPAADAVIAAMTCFSLPLHSGTVDNLSDGDAIYYEFDGTLAVGFGASYGISTTVGGYSLSDVSSGLTTIKNSANLSAESSFKAGANAGLSYKFNWSRKFQCLLLRNVNAGGPDGATLHLFAGNNWDSSLTLSASGGVSSVAAPTITADPGTLAQSALDHVTGGSPLPGSSTLATGLNIAVKKYVTDANNWLSGLAQKANADGNISLSLLFEASDARTSAFTWNFDVTSASFQQAWDEAMKGDYVAAFAAGAELLNDSGFEDTFKRGTTLTFTFFGLEKFTSVQSYFSTTSVVYEDGVFKLAANIGVLSSSQSNSKTTSTSLYFDATADQAPGSTTVTQPSIQLHGVLNCANNPKQMLRLGSFLHAIGITPGLASGAAAAIQLGDTFKAYGAQPGGNATGMVHIFFDPQALQRLRSDVYTKRKQAPYPHLLDQQNWTAYVIASSALTTSPPSEPAGFLVDDIVSFPFYRQYESWARWNSKINGSVDSTGDPIASQCDRHQLAIPSTVAVQQVFGNALPDFACMHLSSYFGAGQEYMNLCDDLRTVVTPNGPGGTFEWSGVVDQMKRIVQDDIDPWYGPATLLALITSTGSTSITVQPGTLNPSAGSGTVVIEVS